MLVVEPAESVLSLAQPDTTPSKVQELNRDDASRLSPTAPEADQHKRAQSARYTPRHGLPVRDGDKEPGRVALAAAVLRDHRLQELAVHIVILQITLTYFASLVATTFSEGQIGFGGTDVDGRATRLSAARAQPRAPLHVTPPRQPTAAT
jgi:hypothetical protein